MVTSSSMSTVGIVWLRWARGKKIYLSIKKNKIIIRQHMIPQLVLQMMNRENWRTTTATVN